jgi:DNA topoisomerase-6 subunit B
MCKQAKISPEAKPRSIHGSVAESLYQAIQSTKIMAPPTNCLSPIGEKAILSGLCKQIKGEFYTAVSRPPAVYRGNPFVIEAGLAFGNRPEDVRKPPRVAVPLAEGEQQDEDSELARVIRYANRVPLLYQQSACATFKAALATTWKNYGVAQSRGALPAGPMVIFVHMASVWVPFTSESKEAIADYDEIQKEITLALRECGRRLGLFVRRRERAQSEFRRRNIFELYIEEVVEACNRLKGGKLPKQQLKEQLQKIATSRTGGMRTDEVLGKAGGGPEGLPNSIIVTPEGIEGEVPVAETVDASADNSGAEPALVDEEAMTTKDNSKRESEEPLEKIQAKTRPDRPAKRKTKETTKADQLPLFAAKGSAATQAPGGKKSVKQKRGGPSRRR